jgi:threonine dehydratase
MHLMFTRTELDAAAEFIRPFVPPTPQFAWPLLAARTGANIWVKHENHTPVGAFKVRGGLLYLDWLLRQGPRPAGLITATRGNHGQSLAFAAARLSVPLTIVVPHGNAAEKNAAMRALGATVIEHGHDFEAARQHAIATAAAQNLHMVPSFHPALVLGVATCALEFLTAVPDLHTLYVPIGQGSGICAAIAVRDLLGLATEIVGVVSAHADAYAQSFERGTLIATETANTLADGLACRVPVQEALTQIRAGAARILRVTDAEVRAAIRAYHEDTHNLAEGAGAAPLAALLQERDQMAGRRVGLILCGANIDRAVLAEILASEA